MKKPAPKMHWPGTLSESLPLRSLTSDDERLGVVCEFVNESDEEMVVKWVTCDGEALHERRVPAKSCHCECTFAGDAFVVSRHEEIVCWYRPSCVPGTHSIRIGGGEPPLVSLRREKKRTKKIEYDTCCVAGFEVEVDGRLRWSEASRAQLLRFYGDLSAAKEKLPLEAAKFLIKHRTRFVVNLVTRNDLTGCCYHSRFGGSWLRNNDLPMRFAGSIQIYCLANYCRDADDWGTGGILVHELAHAYHDKFLSEGHKNDLLQSRFQEARCLYQRVRCRPHYRLQRHYATTNAAEFFAELSTAFLATDANVDYNKWQPHNRHQLHHFDPQTTQLLTRCWLRADTLVGPKKKSSRCNFCFPWVVSPDHSLSSELSSEKQQRNTCVPCCLQRQKTTTPNFLSIQKSWWWIMSPCLFFRHCFLRLATTTKTRRRTKYTRSSSKSLNDILLPT